MTDVKDRTSRKNQRWYKVIDVKTNGTISNEIEIARFSAYGDASMYAYDIAKRPGFATSYIEMHEIQIR